ncbi:MAG: flagellin lysine-N-methylase [Selenomonadaceae bacterium]|nr:flagellin lysine-N-methylase [Selenomonadaceae bacterium]
MDFKKNFVCVEPEYVKDFHCDGRKCNAKCCRGWQVDIDRRTHEVYKSISDREMRTKILDNLYWNEPTNTYRMNLNQTSCPMLGDDLLCSIQKTYGAGYLSNTCAEFPRRTFVIDDFVERSLSMTCPVAAELALLNPEPMKLVRTKLNTTRAACFFYRSNQEMPARKFLYQLQSISFDVLQDHRLTLNQRLKALAIVMSELDSLIHNGREQQLELVSRVYHSADYFQSLTARVKSIPFVLPHYMTTMFGLLETLNAKAIVYYSPTQRVFVNYPIQAFQTDETITTWQQMATVYDRNVEAYREHVLKRFGHVVENYLVHSFFAGIYPCHAPMTLLNNYLLFLTLWKFFEFGLISMATVMGEKFSLDDLLEFIERFANRLDHASLFHQLTLDFITEELSEPIEFLSGLVDDGV